MKKIMRIPARLSNWLQSKIPGIIKAPQPPDLPEPYDLAAYRQFMCQETWLYNADYCKARITIQDAHHLLNALAKTPVMVVFMHQGSWLLMNGALHHQLGLPVSTIGSRRNLDFCQAEERAFWLGVHQRVIASCNAPYVFYTDQSPVGAVRWLRQPGHVLTVALDVREPRFEKPERPFKFLDHTIYLPTGAARLARMCGVQVVPATIEYLPKKRKHILTLHQAIAPSLQEADIIQQALIPLSAQHARAPNQQFFDLLAAHAQPQTVAPSQ
jgi:hypothetical protein